MTTPAIGFGERLFRILAISTVFASALYLFVAIQYGAVTVPHWDHVEFIKILSAYHDGTLTFSSLFAFHNQARPVVSRLLFLLNAILTGWDIRSEFIYVYASIYGAYLLHVAVLCKLFWRDHRTVFWGASALVAILLFSPVGHHNHWYSYMVIMDLCSLLISASLLVLVRPGDTWGSHLFSAALAWVATYTLPNGLFVFPIVIAFLQLRSQRLLRMETKTLFWIINFVAIAALYIPGIPVEEGPKPGIIPLLKFTFIYLGAPLAGLLRFPYTGELFYQPGAAPGTRFPGFVGICVVCGSLYLCWHGRKRFREKQMDAGILYVFTFYALGSALVTAWGRAAMEPFGIGHANGSRYSLYATYMLLGMVHYLNAWFSRLGATCVLIPRLKFLTVGAVESIAFIVFFCFSVVSYTKGRIVYIQSREFNARLAASFKDPLDPGEMDYMIHPNPEFVRHLKSELIRLNMGPYRNRPRMVSVALVSQATVAGDYFSAADQNASDAGLISQAALSNWPSGERIVKSGQTGPYMITQQFYGDQSGRGVSDEIWTREPINESVSAIQVQQYHASQFTGGITRIVTNLNDGAIAGLAGERAVLEFCYRIPQGKQWSADWIWGIRFASVDFPPAAEINIAQSQVASEAFASAGSNGNTWNKVAVTFRIPANARGLAFYWMCDNQRNDAAFQLAAVRLKPIQ